MNHKQCPQQKPKSRPKQRKHDAGRHKPSEKNKSQRFSGLRALLGGTIQRGDVSWLLRGHYDDHHDAGRQKDVLWIWVSTVFLINPYTYIFILISLPSRSAETLQRFLGTTSRSLHFSQTINTQIFANHHYSNSPMTSLLIRTFLITSMGPRL